MDASHSSVKRAPSLKRQESAPAAAAAQNKPSQVIPTVCTLYSIDSYYFQIYLFVSAPSMQCLLGFNFVFHFRTTWAFFRCSHISEFGPIL